ncbi:MAG: hypothetical protein IBJ00_03280 [Alphaproteobacteria bacterium]|nr:hypothetical protein [Alphaproteobacteria bacterium]
MKILKSTFLWLIGLCLVKSNISSASSESTAVTVRTSPGGSIIVEGAKKEFILDSGESFSDLFLEQVEPSEINPILPAPEIIVPPSAPPDGSS